jgi:hypothetical protein
VGEVVKKLPQPCKLVVVGGLKKTLVLHFACARTGQTVTTETRDWNQWCKVGFGLVKLGKCAVEAAVGNPMALASGVGAIADVYKGYRAKDDADFNTFISQPFLTSAESDKLINQLRAGGFFEKMSYDAQTGSWVLNGTLSAEELAKKAGAKAATAATLADQTQVKGSNFGLGKMSGDVISGLATAVGSVAGSVASATGGAGGAALVAEHAESAGAGLGLAADVAGKRGKASAKPQADKQADSVQEYGHNPMLGGAAPTPPLASPKKSIFGSLFGIPKKADTGSGAAAASGGSRGSDRAAAAAAQAAAAQAAAVAGKRIEDLEQRVAMLETKVMRLLQAGEKGLAAKSI